MRILKNGLTAIQLFIGMLLPIACASPCPAISESMPPPVVAESPVPTVARIDEPPRLILQITVDQLRADRLLAYRDRFGENGFRYFLDKGIRFENAHHPQAHTVTVVGHTNLATGAAPSAHGMVGNEWYDRTTKKNVFNIRDGSCELIPDTEKGPGSSAQKIKVDAFADVLGNHTAGASKRFAVSLKDRGAVPLAGHTGKAFWFSTSTGRFITSSCYYSNLPGWAQKWNDLRRSDRFKGTAWELQQATLPYLFGAMDNQPWEADIDHFGRVFPHPFPGVLDGTYFNLLTMSPMGDLLTAEFAVALLEGESLGRDPIPDFLSVSFSATDYIGHYFGPSSLEYEDNLMHLDDTIAGLLAAVDRAVGLSNTLLILSSDHGTPDAPRWLSKQGIPTGRLNPDKIDLAPLYTELEKRFGVGAELIERIVLPWIYLNHERIAEKSLDENAVARVVARFYEKIEGIAAAIPTAALQQSGEDSTGLKRQISLNYYPGRSGDIQIVPQFNWHMEGGSDSLVALHGSPWSYDTWVPLIFVERGFSPRRVFRRVETIDLVPTLSARIGCQIPAGATGNALPEVLGGREAP